MRAIGSNAVVKFVQEDVWGTTPVSGGSSTKPVHGIALRSESIGSTKNNFQSQMINQYRAVTGLGDGNRGVSGNIVTDLLPEGLEILIRHVLGNPTVTSQQQGSSTTYKHTFYGADGYLPGLTIEKGFINISKYFLYTGCRLNSMAINFVQEGFHDVTFDFVGKEEPVPAATSFDPGAVTYQGDDKSGYTGYQCVVSTTIPANGGTPVPGSYVALGNVVSGSINIANNIETDGYVLGSPFRASAEYGTRQCTGNFTTFFENTNLYDHFISGTECGIRFTLNNGLGQKMTITFPLVKLGGESPKIAGPGGLNLPMSFQARRNGTGATSSSVTDVVIEIENTLTSVES